MIDYQTEKKSVEVLRTGSKENIGRIAEKIYLALDQKLHEELTEHNIEACIRNSPKRKQEDIQILGPQKRKKEKNYEDDKKYYFTSDINNPLEPLLEVNYEQSFSPKIEISSNIINVNKALEEINLKKILKQEGVREITKTKIIMYLIPIYTYVKIKSCTKRIINIFRRTV